MLQEYWFRNHIKNIKFDEKIASATCKHDDLDVSMWNKVCMCQFVYSHTSDSHLLFSQ